MINSASAHLPIFPFEDIQRYHEVVVRSVSLRSHFDMFLWLQGDLQSFLPHDILIAAWGNFQEGEIQHDIISSLAGVRSQSAQPETITPLLLHLFKLWRGYGGEPFTLKVGKSGFLLQDDGLKCALGKALQKMRSVMVHGIKDERSNHDCLYVAFSTQESFAEVERKTMRMILPYIDTALRQVSHLPQQGSNNNQFNTSNVPVVLMDQVNDLSEREAEVLCWVALGKTNPEIGSILNISAFTVKNHMQRVFKKLNVSNRAQAVGKVKALVNDS
jgi:transcriptional regulator EpsA